jgi:hypothetical protein
LKKQKEPTGFQFDPVLALEMGVIPKIARYGNVKKLYSGDNMTPVCNYEVAGRT